MPRVPNTKNARTALSDASIRFKKENGELVITEKGAKLQKGEIKNFDTFKIVAGEKQAMWSEEKATV